MNTVTDLAAIFSLLLALATAGGTATEQAGVKSPAESRVSPSKIVLNHNETLVRDVAPTQQADTWSQWVTNIQAYVFNSFTAYTRPPGGDCDEFGCGGNHNETLVSDVTR